MPSTEEYEHELMLLRRSREEQEHELVRLRTQAFREDREEQAQVVEAQITAHFMGVAVAALHAYQPYAYPDVLSIARLARDLRAVHGRQNGTGPAETNAVDED